ncbi:hypothetical protein Acr_00g0055350 [Actinidia rufa]|uniref:Uncharacterized protein n=1 Tax=Actinidia rufa TaxID=165716 RepID=A0A7J0DNW3_9ERIC|nr:hypothetical protein Acr_00g0055350 [Actinidia rufa]
MLGSKRRQRDRLGTIHAFWVNRLLTDMSVGASRHAPSYTIKGQALFLSKRVAKGPSGQRPGQLLPEGDEDSWDVTIRHIQAQMAELQQVLLANNLIKLASKAGDGPSEVKSTQCKDAPWGCPNGKQAESTNETESRSDNITVASRKRRVPPIQTTPAWIFVSPIMPSEAKKMEICW